jgi:hypothetical protein
MMKNLNPVIVFAFSKRECESLAMQMAKIDMNTEEEAAMVENIFNNAMNNLNEDDRNLPQIGHILPLLKRGIGVHHGGLLPILKEVIEILFQEGLIKVLFATETFSIGLNMPAKTVVFTSVQKFDGKEFRHLSGGVCIIEHGPLAVADSRFCAFPGIHPNEWSCGTTRSGCPRYRYHDVRNQAGTRCRQGHGQGSSGSTGLSIPPRLQHGPQFNESRRY